MPTPASTRARRSRVRLSSAERREQLLTISREVFAERGFEGTSVEEIAARAGVSKPVVYEHFGGKDGAYQAVVERETTTLHAEIRAALNNPGAGPRETLERGALALLDYIDRCPDGFRILSRDSSLANPTGSFASILSEIAIQVEEILGAEFARLGHDPRYAHLYAQALVGLVAHDRPAVAGRPRTGTAGGGPAPDQFGLERNGQPEGRTQAPRRAQGRAASPSPTLRMNAPGSE